MSKNLKIKLFQNDNLNDRVKLFRFEIVDDLSFSYIPGQFVILHLETESGEQIKRQYSIANLDIENNFLDLAVTLVENGIGTKCLCSLAKGDTIEASQPRGKFRFYDNKSARHILIGTGTGVVPYRNMLNQIEAYLQDSKHSCIVLQGVKYRGDVLFEKDFLKLCSYDNFDFRLCFSREHNLDDKKGHEQYGYVQDCFSEIGLNPQTDIVYLCGNPYMIEEVAERLKHIGFLSDQIITEKYFSGKKTVESI